MLDKLWEKVGESVGERWVLTVFSPAFVFWAGGFVASQRVEGVGILESLGRSDFFYDLRDLPQAGQLATVLGALLLISFSGTLVERLQSGFLRVLEGYWPGWLAGIQSWRSRRWSRRIDAKYAELDRLRNQSTASALQRRAVLDNELAHLPVQQAHAMPTLLGNLLRAAETYPQVRYGLDAVVCWPRLYFLLSDSLREEIGTARERLNESVRFLVWSLLFTIWTIQASWALWSLVLAWLVYRQAVNAAGIYGDLVRTAFDLKRFDLYQSLGWSPPLSPAEEEEKGRQLTEHLFRGTAPAGMTYERKRDPKED